MKRILVLCTANSCRSQMAEGYLRLYAAGKAEVRSAGIEAKGVDPRAIAAMKEDGIDISGQASDEILRYRDEHFDFVITVCDGAREKCPWYPGEAKRFHYDFPDPARATGTPEEVSREFARVREMIKRYCIQFVKDNL